MDVKEYPVSDMEWKGYGKAAGPIRNRRMLDDFQPDLVLAFPGNKGTNDCIAAARQRDIEVVTVDRVDGVVSFKTISAPRLF